VGDVAAAEAAGDSEAGGESAVPEPVAQ